MTSTLHRSSSCGWSIKGSTRLLEEHGERYADLLEHRRVLGAAFARHADVEVDTQADAFFVAFSSAADALAAADEAQRQLELLAHWLLQLACSERCVDLTGGSTRSPRRRQLATQREQRALHRRRTHRLAHPPERPDDLGH
jgi:hypothetical protein